MKKIYTVTGFHEATEKDNPHQMHGEFVFEGGEDMQVSDGYHTMDDLYNHRNMLVYKLVSAYSGMNRSLEMVGGSPMLNIATWKSRKNSDGSEWDGWFVVGIGKQEGHMITYHLPEKFWNMLPFVEELEDGLWDGHSSNDVLIRLLKL